MSDYSITDSAVEKCGYTVIDQEGIEQPCDRPATSWCWYQDVEHEDLLERACDLHENEGGIRMAALEAQVARVRELAIEARDCMDNPVVWAEITCAEADAMRPALRPYSSCTNYVGGEVLNWDLPAHSATTWADDSERPRMREVLDADGCRHYRIEHADE